MFCAKRRAAKVINYSNKPAFTIQKKSFPKKSSGGVSFTLQQNKHKIPSL
jgi:hypothetical protein